MDLDELSLRAAELFPIAVRFAINHLGMDNPSFDSLSQLCWENYEQLGYRRQADCFEAAVPKLENQLSLEAWCKTDILICGWMVNIHFRPFYLGAGYAHYEVRHAGPIPGFTGTGYRSVFTPLATFAEFSPEEYLASLIPDRPREQQLMLF